MKGGWQTHTHLGFASSARATEALEILLKNIFNYPTYIFPGILSILPFDLLITTPCFSNLQVTGGANVCKRTLSFCQIIQAKVIQLPNS